MSAAILERRHFTVARANEYFTPDGLQKETGQPPDQFRHMALKELLDNALDAAESAGLAPDVRVEFVETDNGLTLTIADNGRGIPAHVVERIIGDFSASTSDKACYRSPMRGAQGNALKTVIGMPVALGADRSRLAIVAAGVQHDIEIWVSPAGDIRHNHHQSAADAPGTRITVMIPGSPECYYWNPARWLFAYALFNPHAQLQIRKIAPVWESPDENEDCYQGEKLSDIERLIADDAESLVRLRELIVAPKHLHKAKNDDGNNVTIIPDLFAKPESSKPQADRGNSRAYTLTRLKNERPDLFEKVVAKELTANRAALDADTAAPWRDVVRQYAEAAIDEQLIGNINQAVISAIWESLRGMPRPMGVTV